METLATPGHLSTGAPLLNIFAGMCRSTTCNSVAQKGGARDEGKADVRAGFFVPKASGLKQKFAWFWMPLISRLRPAGLRGYLPPKGLFLMEGLVCDCCDRVPGAEVPFFFVSSILEKQSCRHIFARRLVGISVEAGVPSPEKWGRYWQGVFLARGVVFNVRPKTGHLGRLRAPDVFRPGVFKPAALSGVALFGFESAAASLAQVTEPRPVWLRRPLGELADDMTCCLLSPRAFDTDCHQALLCDFASPQQLPDPTQPDPNQPCIFAPAGPGLR